MIRVAVAGAGAWGINHVRAFSRQPNAELVVVCDPSPEAGKRAHQIAPKATIVTKLEDVLQSDEIDAVVLATPAEHHAEQAIAALRAGKHVLVEKPLAMTAKDAAAVADAAAQSDRTLLTGHLMLFHPAVEKLREFVDSGELGTILYLYALRVNLGRIRQHENALWSLAPHDISMMDYLLGELPVSVSARGGAYLQRGIEDVVFVNLRYKTGVIAQIQLSWLDPRKERRLTVVGSKKMVEFDDVHPVEKLRIYDKGYDRPPAFTEYAEYLSIRHGDIYIPRIPMVEPLDAECKHFLDCIDGNAKPRADVTSALRVVQVLEAAQRSLHQDGTPVSTTEDLVKS